MRAVCGFTLERVTFEETYEAGPRTSRRFRLDFSAPDRALDPALGAIHAAVHAADECDAAKLIQRRLRADLGRLAPAELR